MLYFPLVFQSLEDTQKNNVMSYEDTSMQELELGELLLPERPRIERIQFQPWENSSGEPSFRVWVILPDDTSDDELTGDRVLEIKRLIFDYLQKKERSLFPYIHILSQSDFKELEVY